MTEGEERRVCAVCGRVLDYHEATGWQHSVASIDPDEHDHIPVPVEDTEVPVRVRCDFCFGDGAPWVVPARSFAPEAFKGVSDSVGDWAACDPCAKFIQRDEWNALIRRVKVSWEDRHGQMAPEIESGLRSLYRELRKNITGPIREAGS